MAGKPQVFFFFSFFFQDADAFKGMAMLPEFGAKPRSEGYSRFLTAWNSISETEMEYSKAKIPDIAGVPGTECYDPPAGFFSELYKDDPGDTGPFAYDTVITMGLAACRAAAAEKDDPGQYFDGELHSQEIVQGPSFEGATGLVSIDKTTRSRDPMQC